ncbi:MAG: M6 family metalloprotease domain-containing protein [Bacteroidaceae bacterium]|nr:M6 family metalloprotease domain-containing protein [Bacteroidaceae bacterium]
MKRLLLAVMLCMGMLSMWAVPAKRVAIEVKQPDGTVLTLTYGGDEYFSYLYTDDGAMVRRVGDAYYYLHIEGGEVKPSARLAHDRALRTPDEVRFVEALPRKAEMVEVALAAGERAQGRRRAQPQRVAEVPSTGEVRVPVVLVQYADVKFSASDPKAIFEGHVNGDDYKTEGGYGSVKEYFEDQSEGAFIPKFDVLGPVTLKNKMDYYGGNDKNGSDKNPRAMITEACELLDKQENVNFARYDNDRDGYVDIVYVLYAGYGEASYPDKLEDTVWPHQWSLAAPMELDGVKVMKYACNNELNGYRGTTIDGIGTFCHEFSHCLGLPDFYPTDGSSGFGMNCWSLMDYGSYNNDGRTPCGYTGYEKDFLGWRPLVEINGASTITLTAMSEGGQAYKVVNDADPDEYYVVEHRLKTKWDTYAPAEGMLILHVDYDSKAWANNTPNNDPAHPRMTVIPADNVLSDATVSGDTYPGKKNNTELTATSTPAAEVYKGGYMNKDITDISMSDGKVTFSFMKGALGVPRLGEPTDITAGGFTVEWEAVEGVGEYEVSLDVLEEDPYMLAEDFDKVKETTTDIGAALDDYTITSGWEGSMVYGLDGAVRLGTPSKNGIMLSPYLETDSTCFTLLYTVKKSDPADPMAGVVLGVIDDEWVNAAGQYELYGFIDQVKDAEWTSYYAVIDRVGHRSRLYIDTRDYDGTAEVEGTRVDIDALYLLEGDMSHLFKEEAPHKALAMAAAKRVQFAEFTELTEPFEFSESSESLAPSRAPRSGGKRYKAVNVFSDRTTQLRYRFDNLDGGRYRATVRSVSEGTYSRPSNAVEVEIVDSMLPITEMTLSVTLHDNRLTIEVDDPEVDLYYTLDGSMPTTYGMRYEQPITLEEKVTMRLMGRKPEHRRSEVYTYNNWFEIDGATYRMESTVEPVAHLSEAFEGNDSRSYAGRFVVPSEVTYDSVRFAVRGIDNHAFRNATGLHSIEVAGKGIESVGEELFIGCTNLRAVVWDITAPLTAEAFDVAGYNNLIVYLPAAMAFEHPLIEKQCMALIIDGKCDALKLSGDYSFCAPRPFTAAKVTLTRTFAQTTGLGSAAGWETIALPFDVEQYVHNTKGDIAPFGAEADRHFWLAQPASKGFAPAKEMRAHVPYIIAIPNHVEYGNNSLQGQVTFTATDATIQATDEAKPVVIDEYSLVPTYEKVTPSMNIYALNVGDTHEQAAPGSVFVPAKYTVKPFGAYLVPADPANKAPLYRIQMSEPAEEAMHMERTVTVHQGTIIVTLPEDQAITVYDLAGRRVRTIDGKCGVNMIDGLNEGLYLIENTKVYVRH